jgi:hypothetical protein
VYNRSYLESECHYRTSMEKGFGREVEHIGVSGEDRVQ